MHPLIRPLCFAAASLTALFGLSACSFVQKSTPASFYVLSSELPKGQEPLVTEEEAGNTPIVAVAQVGVSAFLDRPQISLRRGENQLTINEFSRWGEPLGNGVTRTVRNNLVRLLGQPDISLPWTRTYKRDFNLFIVLQDIDLSADGSSISIEASYRFSDGTSNRTLASAEKTYSAPLPAGLDENALYPAIVARISELLGQFSVDVAEESVRLHQQKLASEQAAAATTAASTTPSASSASSSADTGTTAPAAAASVK